jgi:hypothetical protein
LRWTGRPSVATPPLSKSFRRVAASDDRADEGRGDRGAVGSPDVALLLGPGVARIVVGPDRRGRPRPRWLAWSAAGTDPVRIGRAATRTLRHACILTGPTPERCGLVVAGSCRPLYGTVDCSTPNRPKGHDDH